ncbi:protein-glutamate O-methyltransferase CheR [Chitinispirillales bacterium ANBcel5]|uniref:CheR family methyltransferase n=1 Tax=Cellulosispirillum alkaliphilum TaxID=3039283 RepID=UPI002A54557B|nr:protein-glutamate O-methyltransferase CheR [Chitinispirillales bacterium ANBcel5]
MGPVKIDNNEFKLIGDYIEKHCGIRLKEDKMYLVESRLMPLMVESGCRDFTSFYYKALADKSNYLRDKIVDAMTTNETLWFRDGQSFKIFNEKILDELISENPSEPIHIWSAACSTGQEPYSLAIAILEASKRDYKVKPERFKILATDISPTVLFLANTGRYDSFAMSRGMDPAIKERYFYPDGKIWLLKNDVKKLVTFKKFNLQENFSSLGKFNFILCRNVLIYFSEEFKKDILKRIARQLKPPGYLMLGSSESLINYSEEFVMKRHNGSLFYQLKTMSAVNGVKQ